MLPGDHAAGVQLKCRQSQSAAEALPLVYRLGGVLGFVNGEGEMLSQQ